MNIRSRLRARIAPPWNRRAWYRTAKRLEFEEAAALRDQLKELRELQIYAG